VSPFVEACLSYHTNLCSKICFVTVSIVIHSRQIKFQSPPGSLPVAGLTNGLAVGKDHLSIVSGETVAANTVDSSSP
jgi:hypothetical protein